MKITRENITKEIDELMKEREQIQDALRKSKGLSEYATNELRKKMHNIDLKIDGLIALRKAPSVSPIVEGVKDTYRAMRGPKTAQKEKNPIVEGIRNFFGGLKKVTTIEQSKAFGSKIKEVVAKKEAKGKRIAQQNKDMIIATANQIAAKKEKNDEEFNIGMLLSSAAASVVVILSALGLSYGTGARAPEPNTNPVPVTSEASNTASVSTGTSTRETVAVTSQTTPVYVAPEVNYVVDKDDVYEPYRVYNEFNFANFRDYPSTRQGESNVLAKAKEGEIIYIKPTRITYPDNSGEHDWRAAVYYTPDGSYSYEGYVDARLLATVEHSSVDVVIKDRDIVEVDRSVNSQEEIEINKQFVDANSLNVRGTPSTQTQSNIITSVQNGEKVYTFDAPVENNTLLNNSDHDWRKALYYDGRFYKAGYVDANYLTDEMPSILEATVGSTSTETTPVQTTTQAETTPSTSQVSTYVTTYTTPQVSTYTTTATTPQTTYETTVETSNEEEFAEFAQYPGYVEYLKALKQAHPNWEFKAEKIGFDFYQCVNKEVDNGCVAVQNEKWRNEWFDPSRKLVDGYSWLLASKEGAACMMDPRNFLNEKQIFQFEDMRDSDSITLSDVEMVFADVGWANAENFSYTDVNGNVVTMDKSFAQLVYEAAKANGVSPISMAARIRNEQGADEKAGHGGCGVEEGFIGYYNYGNINSAGGGDEAWKSGLRHAQSVGWDTPEKSIQALAKFLHEKYISNNQDTYYKFKFNFDGNGNPSHQYMTSLTAAYADANSSYNFWVESGMINKKHIFYIPVYENMPTKLCERPAQSYYLDDAAFNTPVHMDYGDR